MRRWTNEVIVGASIVAAIFITIFGYVYLREIPVRQQGYEITILFDNVAGLESGDPVTVSGLKVGRIKDLRLQQGTVSVRVWLDGKIPFPKDSRAAIRSVGMIGEKYIDLMPGGSPEFLEEDDVIIGKYISDLADSGGGINNMMDETKEILKKLNVALDTALSVEAQRAIEKTLVNTERITHKLDQKMNQNMTHLSSTLAHLDTLTAELKKYWSGNEARVDSITQNVSASTADLPALVSKLDSTMATTQRLLHAIENREGAVGKAVYDDEIYNKANKTIDEVQALLDDVKKNPAKYLQFSIIDLF